MAGPERRFIQSQGRVEMSDLSKVLHGAFVLLLGATDVRAAEGQTIEEVIVTAQKRAEALIDVPQSVSVVDGACWSATRRRVSRTI